MKESTFLNKIKQIRDKAAAPIATVLSAPAVMKSKMQQTTADLKFNAMKAKNSAKNMPDYDSDGNITEGFKVRNSYKKGK